MSEPQTFEITARLRITAHAGITRAALLVEVQAQLGRLNGGAGAPTWWTASAAAAFEDPGEQLQAEAELRAGLSTGAEGTECDMTALDRIAELLAADARGEWGPELGEAIAEIVRGTGRETGR